MDIDYALRNLKSKSSRDYDRVKKLVDSYSKTGNAADAREAIAIVKSYDDESARVLERVLRR